MRGKSFWILVLLLVCVIGAAIIMGAAFIYLVNRPSSISRDSILEITLGGTVGELPPTDPLTVLFDPDAQNLWDLRQTLAMAAVDERVAAVFLEIQPLALSWAQIEEVRDYLMEFRESGKSIEALLAVDMGTESELYLATAADHITLNPAAGLIVDGLLAEITFRKRTLEKLGIKPDFMQLKEFKSPETDSRTQMSLEFREMAASILDDLQNRFIKTISADRGISVETVWELVNKGILPAPAALEARLVDELGYRSQVRNRLGNTINGTYQGISAKKYFENAAIRLDAVADRTVAVVGANGVIIAGSSEPFAGIMGGSTIADHLRKLRSDSSIDGVILRVNSPGGSAVGSEMVWREIQLLEEENKPVIVSMSNVAGSGGYYISMGARRIISQPSTLTGSIGVIFGKYDLSGLYDWLGMDIDRIQTASNSGVLSLTMTMTQDQREGIRSWMDNIYDTFVSKAAEGRGQTFEELEPKAHGRIYTGKQALEVGLVDRLGGIMAAVEEMKEELGLGSEEELRLEIYPRPKTFWQMITSGEVFEIEQPQALIRLFAEQIRQLETPRPWLLAPEVIIR